MELHQFPADENHVKLLGRTRMAGDTRYLAWSATGIEFTVHASVCRLMLVGDNRAEKREGDTDLARIAIEVDGKRCADLMMDAPLKCVTAFEESEARSATVRVLKLSESAMSIIGIRGIETDGDIRPTAEKGLFIEFVGDSITCGYGVDDEDASHAFRTATEDASRAYAYRTAQLLDADYSLVSLSGYGIVSGFSGDGRRHDDQLLPTYYQRLGFSYSECDAGQPQAWAWDFCERQPDVVAINLGTNDASYCTTEERRLMYRADYAMFLRTVRACNPDAHILCTLGVMGDALYPYLEDAVADYRRDTGDENVSLLRYEPIIEELEGYVADYHPTERTHTRVAGILADRIRELMPDKTRANTQPLIALTFDDGPNDTTTYDVLRVLEKHHVKGTFFLIGDNITEKSIPAIHREMAMRHEIECHSQKHAVMSEMSAEAVREDIARSCEAIRAITGRQPVFFRPPYIAVSEELFDQVGMPFICGYGCEDWVPDASAEHRESGMLERAADGAMMLLHDMEGNDNTVQAIDRVIPRLQAQGYRFVTLEEMFAIKGLKPLHGVLYSQVAQTEKWRQK